MWHSLWRGVRELLSDLHLNIGSSVLQIVPSTSLLKWMKSHLWYSFHFWPLTFQCYYNNCLFCLVISTLHKYLTSLAKFLSWKSSLRLSVMPWDHWKLEHRRWVCPLSVLHLIYIRPCTVWQRRIQQPSVLIHSPLGISASLVYYATASAVQTVVDKSAAAAVFLSLPCIVKHSVIYC